MERSAKPTISFMLRSNFQKISANPQATIIAAALALLLIGLTGLRTYRQYSFAAKEFDRANSGHSDFHNGVYYPSLAFRNGVNPYSPVCMDDYPISRPAPTYSPLVFLLHVPFTLPNVPVADILFFAFNVAMLAALAWLAIKFSCDDSDEESEPPKFTWFGFWLMFCLVLISRPGHITLFTGYFTAEIVLGSIVAIHYARHRPAISGLGLMFASLKPTFVIPLAILMLCRRNFKAVIWGATFSLLAAAIGLGWLASSSSVSEVVQEIRVGQQALHDDVTEFPVNTWTRTDIVGMAAKLLNTVPDDVSYLSAMLLLLIVPGIAVYRLSNNRHNGAASLSGAIIGVSVLLSIYHHSYDCLLLVVPWVGITLFGCAGRLLNWERRIVILMLAVVASNYLSTRSARSFLGFKQHDFEWQLITLINGVCLIVAAATLIRAAFRKSKPDLRAKA